MPHIDIFVQVFKESMQQLIAQNDLDELGALKAKGTILLDLIQKMLEEGEQIGMVLFTHEQLKSEHLIGSACWLSSTPEDKFMPLVAVAGKEWERKNNVECQSQTVEKREDIKTALVKMHRSFIQTASVLIEKSDITTQTLALRAHLGTVFDLGRIICEHNHLDPDTVLDAKLSPIMPPEKHSTS